MKYQLLHNCTPEAFLLLSLKSFLSNRESWLKITTVLISVAVSMMSRAIDSDHPLMTGAMEGGIGHNRKVERMRLSFRDHRCAVYCWTSHSWCSSGLWPHGRSHCRSHLQLLKLWLKYTSAYAFCSWYEHTGIPPKDDEAQDDVCHPLCGSSAREFSQQQCD